MGDEEYISGQKFIFHFSGAEIYYFSVWYCSNRAHLAALCTTLFAVRNNYCSEYSYTNIMLCVLWK